VLEEGLAEAIGCGMWATGQDVVPTVEMIDWIVDDGLAADEAARFDRYQYAQSFVSYLLSRYGVDALRSLYREMPQRPSFEQADDVFRSYLGVGIADTVDDWVAVGPRTLQETCYPVPLCDAPDLPQAPERARLTCGPNIDPLFPRKAVVRSFQVYDEDDAVVVRLRPTNDAGWVTVSGCAMEMRTLQTLPDDLRMGILGPSSALGSQGRVMLAELAPGRYYATAQAAADEDVSAELTRGSFRFASSCGGSSLLNLDELAGGTDEVSMYVRPGAARWLGVSSVQRVRLRVVFPRDDIGPELESVTVCLDGCDRPCATLTASDVIDVDAGRPALLGVQAREDLDFGWLILGASAT
jgi:hypothetical protein